jgi:NADH-quinone oxidoreductase subunit I
MAYQHYKPSTYVHTVINTVKTILTGMRLTFQRMFHPAITLQYPLEKMDLPERSRMRLFMKYEDCIGCNQCANACPVDCIDIETIKANKDEDLGITSTGRPKKLWLLKFKIDMAKCCYCALCTYPCPTDCIYMTTEYEFSVYHRENLNYSFSPFTDESAAAKKAEVQKRAAELKAEKAIADEAAEEAKAASEQPGAGESEQTETPPENPGQDLPNPEAGA